MASYEHIARAFRDAINDGQLSEPTVYYRVQTSCTACLTDATGNAKVALFCAAQLAGKLASAIDDGGITDESEGYWAASADALEVVIGLADSAKSAQELLWALSNAITKIG